MLDGSLESLYNKEIKQLKLSIEADELMNVSKSLSSIYLIEIELLAVEKDFSHSFLFESLSIKLRRLIFNYLPLHNYFAEY